MLLELGVKVSFIKSKWGNTLKNVQNKRTSLKMVAFFWQKMNILASKILRKGRSGSNLGDRRNQFYMFGINTGHRNPRLLTYLSTTTYTSNFSL